MISVRSAQRFLIKAMTAEVIACTPVLIVGPGTGLKKGECREGSVSPFALASATRSGA